MGMHKGISNDLTSPHKTAVAFPSVSGMRITIIHWQIIIKKKSNKFFTIIKEIEKNKQIMLVIVSFALSTDFLFII